MTHAGHETRPLLITLDGASFAFDYRLRLSGLYTVTGVR